MPAALILDYGGVLSYAQQPEDVTAMANAIGCNEAALSDAYWHYRKDLDLGLDVRQYWQKVLGDIGRQADVERLLALDLASWLRQREAMWEIARDFPGRTAMLTNNWPVFMQHLREKKPFDDIFDVVVASCDVGVAKPTADIYQICLDRLEVPAAETLFVDDSATNVAAGAALGLQTFHFTSDADLPALSNALADDKTTPGHRYGP